MTYDQWRVKDQAMFPDQVDGHTYTVAGRAFAAGREQGLSEVLKAVGVLEEAIAATKQEQGGEDA